MKKYASEESFDGVLGSKNGKADDDDRHSEASELSQTSDIEPLEDDNNDEDGFQDEEEEKQSA